MYWLALIPILFAIFCAGNMQDCQLNSLSSKVWACGWGILAFTSLVTALYLMERYKPT